MALVVLAAYIDSFPPTPIVAASPAPSITSPIDGTILTTFGPSLTWSNPPGTTQYHLQVTPANNDGPGIDLIRVAAEQFAIPPPPVWYGLLPDMTYTWRVRVTDKTTSLPATDPSWGPWATQTFRTPVVSSATITLASPTSDELAITLQPALRWTNSRSDVFYYEVQLSKGRTFNTDPATATAMVYGELIHGGVTNPPNSYRVPSVFPLENETTYYWRVRPRVQGDGTPLPWPVAGSFTTPSQTAAHRIEARTFPSVFQAWTAADSVPGEDPLRTVARHDLFWDVYNYYGLKWDDPYPVLGNSFTPASLAAALDKRGRLLTYNPNMVLLMVFRWKVDNGNSLPADHPWWQRDANGNRIPWTYETQQMYYLDWHNPAFRAHLASQARAAVQSGVVDGVMLDQWHDTESDADTTLLLQGIRQAIGKDKLILVNGNRFKVPKSAPYINGTFMEAGFWYQKTGLWAPRTPADWQQIAETLLWAEVNVQQPRINALETWWISSRSELDRMRATVTLALTHSNGYALFADPNPLPASDHGHGWYSFWDQKSLGKPTARMVKRPDSAFQREFFGGTVIYNPLGNEAVTVTFTELRRSAATGQTATTFTVSPMDGDLYLR